VEYPRAGERACVACGHGRYVAQNDSLDMKRILKDLKAIKEENEALEVDKPKKEKKEKKAK
jgi:hypothetical protein